jgi:hypothetical protein
MPDPLVVWWVIHYMPFPILSFLLKCGLYDDWLPGRLLPHARFFILEVDMKKHATKSGDTNAGFCTK